MSIANNKKGDVLEREGIVASTEICTKGKVDAFSRNASSNSSA